MKCTIKRTPCRCWLRPLILTLSLLLFVQKAQGQEATIVGKVVDADTKQTLPGANVFVDQTLIGGATDENGLFRIEGLSPGSYKLVASMVGYTLSTQQFEITPADTLYTFNFSLDPNIIEIGEIEVVDQRARGWRRKFRQFKHLFLGINGNARKSEILNPFVLNFDTSIDVFEASASEPIQIENRALGYHITFLLTDFRMEWDKGLLHMQGPFYFTELIPSSEKEAKKWKANRIKTYEGSLRHLLSSMVKRNHYVQGFVVRLDNRKNAPYSREQPTLKSIEGLNFVRPTDLEYVYWMSFPGYLFVGYGEDQSWIKMNKEDALIHETGYVYSSSYRESGAVTVFGALSKRRVSDLMPRDFDQTSIKKQ